MSRVIPPSVTYPSPNEWPVTVIPVTNITRAVIAKVTAPNHGFTQSNDVGITQLDFSQVNGMEQINGKFGYIMQVIDTNNFTIGINTTTFSPYSSGGFCNINASPSSPTDPFQNTFSPQQGN